MPRLEALVATITLVGLTIGCSGDGEGAPPATLPTTASPSSTPTTTPTPTLTPTPTPTPTPSRATPKKVTLVGQPMKAKDGKNTDRCLKRSCEVLVSTGTQFRVRTSNGSATIIMEAVSASGLTVGIYGDSGFSSQASSGPAPGEFVAYNDLRFIAVAVSGKSAVLRVTH